MHQLHDMSIFGVPGPVLFVCGLVWGAVLVAWIGNNPVALAITAFLSILTAKAYILGSGFVREFNFGSYEKLVFILMGIAIIVAFIAVYHSDISRWMRGPVRVDGLAQRQQIVKVQRKPSIIVQPPHQPQSHQPIYMYHGTKSREAAMDILKNNRWVVGDSKPTGIWLTPSYLYAGTHAGIDGRILKVEVDPDCELIEIGEGIYLVPIPDAIPHTHYYTLPGIRVIEFIDYNQSKAA